MCIFNSDGSVLISRNKNQELALLDKNMAVLWSKKMHVHHQLNKTASGDYLVLSSDVLNNTRFDKLLRIDHKGDIVATFRFVDHLDLFEKRLIYRWGVTVPFNWDPENIDLAKFEKTHVNSFYEVGTNDKENKLSYLKRDNVIVNSLLCACTFILNKDLTKIEHTIYLPGVSNSHDAQITPEGNYLVYVNRGLDQTKNLRIWELDLETNDFIFSLTANHLYSPVAGGVQKLNPNLYFFSDITSSRPKTFFVDNKSRIFSEINFKTIENATGFQQAKIVFVNEFLNLNPGP